MVFAQLTWREGLRDIVTCLNAKPEALYHLGFREPVARATLPGKLHRTLQLLSVHPFEKVPLHELFAEKEFSAPPIVDSNQLLLLNL
jgi:Domain of unknown function (DUF4372)